MNAEYSGRALDILEAARDLFMEKGLSATTTKEIAKKAGVNEVTLFRCFKSKAALFEKVFEHYCFRPDYAQFESRQPDNLHDYLVEVGRFVHAIFMKNIDVILIEMKEYPILETKAIIDTFLYEFYTKMVDSVIRLKSCPRQEAEVFAIIFLSSVYGLFINLYIFKTFKSGVTFEQCFDTLIRMYA